jgi:hypothetical protein
MKRKKKFTRGKDEKEEEMRRKNLIFIENRKRIKWRKGEGSRSKKRTLKIKY